MHDNTDLHKDTFHSADVKTDQLQTLKFVE